MAAVLWLATDDAVRLTTRPQAPPKRRLVAQTAVTPMRLNSAKRSLFDHLFPATDVNSDLLAPGTVLNSTPLRDPNSELARGVRKLTDAAAKVAKGRGLMREGSDPFFSWGNLLAPLVLIILINLLIFGSFLGRLNTYELDPGMLQTRIGSTLIAIVGTFIAIKRLNTLGRKSRLLLTPQGRAVTDRLKAIGAFLRLPESQRSAMLLRDTRDSHSPAARQAAEQPAEQRDRLLLSHAERLLPWAVLVSEERACLEWIAALHKRLGTAPTWCASWANTSLADSVASFEREAAAAGGGSRRR